MVEFDAGTDAAGRMRQVIRRAISDSGMAQKDLAAKAGMGEQVLSHFLRGRRKRLRVPEISRLAQALGLSEEALMGARNPAASAPGISLPLPSRRFRVAPVYPIGAGYSIHFGDADMPVGESFEEPVFTDVSDPNAFAGKIVGSSMDPGQPGERGFYEGDIVIFDTKAEVRNGAYCLARFDDGSSTFKQVFFEDDSVRLHALNPHVADELRPRSSIRGIYRAARHVQRL
jgi:SOS-response transcriptional repressor LexA